MNRDPVTGRILPSTLDDDERFWAKVRLEDEIFPENGCMIWTGAKDLDGYGQFFHKKKQHRAVRWAYERYRGPIPDGYQLDHLCRVVGCVNPDHVEPVTASINVQRGIGPILFGARNRLRYASRTHCSRGHELTPENVYNYQRDGQPRRGCKICRYENSKRWRINNLERARSLWREYSERRKKK